MYIIDIQNDNPLLEDCILNNLMKWSSHFWDIPVFTTWQLSSAPLLPIHLQQQATVQRFWAEERPIVDPASGLWQSSTSYIK